MAFKTHNFSLDLPASTTREEAERHGEVEAVGSPVIDFALVGITRSDTPGLRKFNFRYKTGFPG